MSRLTKKQQCFIAEYLIDLNGTQAAIRAGYSSSSARQIAEENMSKPDIRARIDAAMAERSKRTGINQDRIIMELARIAFVIPSNVIDFENASITPGAAEDDLAAVASVKVKTFPTTEGTGIEREIKLSDKIKALELLGKHLGMFRDKIDLNAEVKHDKLDDIISQLWGHRGLEEDE